MDVHAVKGWAAPLQRGSGMVTVLVMLVMLAMPASARERTPFAAHTGMEVAQSAAKVWAEDAVLVYVENDEAVGRDGSAERWGYLFFSPATQRSRAYSVREGQVLAAEDLSMDFVAPPVAAQWIDSGAALAAAEANVGREFREKHAGVIGTMLLARGVFAEGSPDQTNWVLVYTSPGQPSLFVVVDAADGRVRRTWRG